MVLLRDVSADADGIQSVQPGFLPAPPPAVAQNLVPAEDEHVGDELFVTFVLLGGAAVEVKHLVGGRDHRQVFAGVQVDPLKHAQVFKQFPLKTQHSFFSGHWMSLFLLG